MAATKGQSISVSLASATCALLGGVTPAAVQAQEEPGWDFNTSLLYYGEDADRVQDLSISVLATRTFMDDRALTMGLTVDALTGATPNGGQYQAVPQTFTSPSGNAVFTVPAGTLALDDSFRDTRVAVSANWTQPFSRLYTFDAGLSASKEYDYMHLGANAKISRDFNQRNTTVSAGFAYAADSLNPVGGTPTPLTPMADVGDLSNRIGDQDKDVVDFVVGVTQVISRNLVVQANYSFSDSSGYLNDPYKIVSLVDGITGDVVPRTPAPGLQGPSHEYVFESRPDQRTKHSLYGQAKYYMNGKVLDASYRYMTDDWDIDSHTVDLRFRWPVGERSYFEPHLRYYTQTEANFYQVGLVDSVPLPMYASSDYRLGNFDAITAGLKYGWTTRNDNDMSVRLELYQQRGSIPADRLIGSQVGLFEYPDLDAVILQFSYRFGR
ncbi:MAG: DUF3570 domain-containing protein [Gammaproteobacteria bacterium]|nr:DUF3570 domain-containing protein [Gammaproteobacteria bacterium]MDH5241695.1 DUF3570 domain-containing protein [Gammaproteobacteria bacterium]MDH5262584.1 DUF3570 domain-containing protein [Gammaproteobacteria bacterium]MDH5583713.1 DUF3570 domain-containing protein [Gammaproteobacteria bacterium]